MKTTFTLTAALLLLGAYVPAATLAQASPTENAATAEVAKAKGTVNSVDQEAGTVNINHEAIPAIRWPSMTMDFEVTDKNLLAGLQPGQKVVFGLVRAAPGEYRISHIKAAK